MVYNIFKCKTDFNQYNASSKEMHFNKGDLIWYTRFNLNGIICLRICYDNDVFIFPNFNIEDYVEPLSGVEKELADIFISSQKEIDKVAESFNPVPATEEQKERLEKLCRGFVKVELTPIQKMSDNKLRRKLDIARRNVDKWQNRIDDIQAELYSRYRYWRLMQDPEW